MPLLTIAATLALTAHTPVKGDAAFVWTHAVKYDRFPEFVPKALVDFRRVMETKGLENTTLQLEDAANWRVTGVMLTPSRERVRAMNRDPEVRQALQELTTYNREKSKEDEYTVDGVNFTQYAPKVGNVVYLYTHLAKRGRFEDLRRTLQLPNKFSAVFGGWPRLILGDARRGKLLMYVFFPDQAAADRMHTSRERGPILLESEEYRASFTTERFVLAGIR